MNSQNYKLNWNVDQLRNGCMLAAIAHAIMVAHYPELSNEHSWDGINYNVQDSAGVRGTITFKAEYCIAAFRNDNSERLVSSNCVNEAITYFDGAPKEILWIAQDETLQYLLDNVNGAVIPLITTAFWAINDKLFTNDTFETMIENGGFLLERQLMDFDKGKELWKEYYDMSSNQVELMKAIYKHKIAKPNSKLILSKDEIALIEISDEYGFKESKASFNEIGIYWNE